MRCTTLTVSLTISRQKKMGVIVHICGQMRNVYAQVEMIHSDVLSFDSCVAMSDAKKHLKKHVLNGKCQHMDTGIWEAGESGTVSSQMLERWFRDYFTGMWSGNKITAYEYSGNQIGNRKATEEKS